MGGGGVVGFQIRSTPTAPTPTTLGRRPWTEPTQLRAQKSASEVEEYLSENFPMFMELVMSQNDEVWKSLRKSGGYTVFAVVDECFTGGEKLSGKQIEQLRDVRNLETTEKIASYHAIAEPVSAEALFNAGGVLTMGGEVPIEPSVSGGFFGIGGKEDGGVTLNGAKVLETRQVGEGCTLHVVDDLISPKLLWRYMDQLRIPGSK